MTVRQRWTMVAAVLGSGIVFLDGTVVNVALKKIGEDLPASIVGVLEGQTYVTSGYLATLAALLILAGALADFYGRRRIFTIGLAGFGITTSPLKPGAVILMQDSELQLRGASMRTRWPSISNEIPPACAEVVAINSAARM